MAGFVERFACRANLSGCRLCNFNIKLAVVADKRVLVGDPERPFTFRAAHYLNWTMFQRHINIASQATKFLAVRHKYGASTTGAEKNLYVTSMRPCH